MRRRERGSWREYAAPEYEKREGGGPLLSAETD